MSKPPDEWRSFEIRIEKEAPLFGYTCWKVPTDTKMFFKMGTRQFQQVKSKPDFAAGILGLAAFFDAKSTIENTWAIKANVLRHDKHVDKLTQWHDLKSAWDLGNISGYLIWFVNLKKITWASCGTVQAFIDKGETSVRPDLPQVYSQDADKPLNLKVLMAHDLKRRQELIIGSPQPN